MACYDHEGVTFDNLAKVNLIFGGNGTGKTTLSRVLEDAGQYKSCSVEWEGEPVDVLAYNRDFRERNLQQDIPGVFTVGEEYIKTERDLDYWRERRKEYLIVERAAYEGVKEISELLELMKNGLVERIWKEIYLPLSDMKECMAGYAAKVSFAERIKHYVKRLLGSFSILQIDDDEGFRKLYKELFVDENDDPDNPHASTLRMEREQLTNDLWRYMAQKAEPMVKEHDHSVREANAVLEQRRENHDDAMRSLSQVDTSIQSTESIISSLKPSIERINTALRSMGFTNFSIQPSPLVHHHYQIQRDDGSLATQTLSEGEMTFLTFLYYMQLVKGSVTKSDLNQPKVLVIDDPISSLDSNIMYVVTTMLRQLIKEVRSPKGKDDHGVRQIFVLSHNVFFYKEVSFVNTRANRQKDTYHWILFKNGNKSDLRPFGQENTIRGAYEQLWYDLKEGHDRMDSNGLQNVMRRIIETYFVMFGGYDKRRLIPDHFSDNPEELAIVTSLAKWADEGSHSASDDFYMESPQIMNEKYMAVFRQLFVIKIAGARMIKEESGGQELSYTHYTPINTIYSLRNRYLSVA